MVIKLYHLVILLLSIGLLVSCTKQTMEKKPIEITFSYWGMPEERREVDEQVMEFENLHPEIDVKIFMVEVRNYYAKLLTMFAGGTAPDVMALFGDWGYEFSHRGVILDLTPFIEREKIDKSRFIPQIFDACEYKGKMYAFPFDQSSMVLHYNKNSFNEAQLNYPDETWDWNKFLDAARKLTRDTNGDGKIDQYGFITHSSDWYHLAPFIFQNGDSFADEGYFYTGTPGNIEANTEAVQFYIDLMYKYRVAPDNTTLGQMDTLSFFSSGRGAMIIDGAWSTVEFNRRIKGFSWDVAVLPYCKRRGTTLYFDVLAISKTTRNKEAAWEFVKFLSETKQRIMPVYASEEKQKEWFETKGLLNINYRAFIKSIEYGRIIPYLPSKFSQLIQTETELMWINKEPVKDVFERIQKKVADLQKSDD